LAQAPVAGSEVSEQCATISVSASERELLERVQQRCDPKTWLIFLRVTADEIAPELVAEEFGVPVNVVYLAKSRITRRIRQELAKRRDA
jgi:DNA-directed RNA polymerase specialized sigma24 family protein